MRGFLICCAAIVVGVLVYRIGARAMATPVDEIIVLPDRGGFRVTPRGGGTDLVLAVSRDGVAVFAFGHDCFHHAGATTCFVEHGDDGAWGTTTGDRLELVLEPLAVVTGDVPWNAHVRYRHGDSLEPARLDDMRTTYTALAAVDRGRFTVRIFQGPGVLTIRDADGRVLDSQRVIGTPGARIDLGTRILAR